MLISIRSIFKVLLPFWATEGRASSSLCDRAVTQVSNIPISWELLPIAYSLTKQGNSRALLYVCFSEGYLPLYLCACVTSDMSSKELNWKWYPFASPLHILLSCLLTLLVLKPGLQGAVLQEERGEMLSSGYVTVPELVTLQHWSPCPDRRVQTGGDWGSPR